MDPDLDAADRIRQLDERLRMLSSTLRAFAEATTDYERLLDIVARSLSEVVKDGCVMRLLTDGGWLAPVAVHIPIEDRITDPEVRARVRAHISQPRNISEQGSARAVLETGQALIIPHLDLQQLRASTAPEVVAAYEAIGIHSVLLVALRVRGESLGLLALVRFLPESPPFSEADRDLAQALADHAALAVTNARLLRSALGELAERERVEAVLHKTEEQLRHAQKMEAIGRLAGSVAHDFNNLLSVILGNGSFLMEELKSRDTLREEVSAIMKAGQRAADLTRQLLTFSRQQLLVPRVLDLNAVVQDSESILRRLLGKGVDLVTICDPKLGNVRADAGQISQVIVNLAINARDAMPEGGKLTIETYNVTLDEAYAAEHVGAVAGPHVMLAVSDTGVGMDPATQARMFEPFFTTKEPGKGTGLGLATVFGIVQQCGGTIWVYSEPGGGTTFKVYLPQCDDPRSQAMEAARPVSLEGDETILLVEDQDDVRLVAVRALERYGYHVLEAQNAEAALRHSQDYAASIQLLLTDVVMRGMNGRELTARLLAMRPTLRVLFMSGYTDNAVVHHGILASGIEYLQKPLVPDELVRRVREVLDSPRVKLVPMAG